MNAFNDFADTALAVWADYEAGKYASLAADLGNGVASLLNDLFGYQATPGAILAKFPDAYTTLKADIFTAPKAKTTTAGFNSDFFLWLLSAALDFAQTVWNRLHPDNPIP